MPRPVAELKGKHLHLDCFAGIAGDMFLGAMLDLGVPEAVIRDGLAKLPVTGYELRVGRARHMGVEGCNVHVAVQRGEAEHGHAHEHRRWATIRRMIGEATLPPAVERRALDMFERVARAEARLHGTPLEDVEFHEVGAVDSIVDIVGAALALDFLAPRRVTARPVPLGHGFTRCAHGTLPVPAPAAVEILAAAGAQVRDGAADIELCTPTGAAIIASCVEGYRELPGGQLLAAGYGAGDSTLPDRPNHLRAIILDSTIVEEADLEAVVVEANIDDMAPEWCGHLLERLFAAGARDVWYTPIVMKKGRPALTVAALCAPSLLETVGGVLLAESTSIGFRHHRVGRRTLQRRSMEVQTPYGMIAVKVALDGERVLNVSPEFEVCKAAADRHGVPLKVVHAAAMAAYLAERAQPE
jgi:hypothetical protein